VNNFYTLEPILIIFGTLYMLKLLACVKFSASP